MQRAQRTRTRVLLVAGLIASALVVVGLVVVVLVSLAAGPQRGGAHDATSIIDARASLDWAKKQAAGTTPTATAAAADVPERRSALVSCIEAQTGDVCALDSTTGALTRLTACGDVHGFAWSPDGAWIALLREEAPQSAELPTLGLYIAPASDPGNMHRIDLAFGAWWSPDGSRIAYSGADNTHGEGYFVVRPDGGDRTWLGPVWLHEDTGVSWSSDGARLICGDVEGLYVVRADGSGRSRLLSADQPPWHAWRPYSNEFAFVGAYGGIHLAPVAAGRSSQICETASTESWAIGPLAWAPDGSLLAFRDSQYFADAEVEGGPGGQLSAIFIVSAGGENLKQATQWTELGWGDQLGLSWANDGRRIAYCSAGEDVSEIHVLDLTTGEDTWLTRNLQGMFLAPRWVPAGAPGVEPATADTAEGVLDALEEHLRHEYGTERAYRYSEYASEDLEWGFTPGRELMTDVAIGTPAMSGRWARVFFISLMNNNYWLAFLQKGPRGWAVVDHAGPKSPDDWANPLRAAGCPEHLLETDLW